MTDGLGMLDEKRSRRARSIPSSKHPPRTKPVSIVELQPQHDPAPEPSVEAAVAPPPEAPVGKLKASQVVQEPTVKMSIYLEPSDDLYLEEIAYAGKTSRPRVAISRSAIVRLALEQLANTMTTEQIVAELRGRGTQHEGRGRKRR